MIKRLLFLDGKVIATNKQFLENFSPGKLRGKGVFETMRSYKGKVFLIEEHLKRLCYGLRKMNIKLPYSRKKLQEYLKLSLSSNALKDARLRLIVWRGRRNARVSIVSWPYRPAAFSSYRKGFKATVSKIKQDYSHRNPLIKSIDYLPFLLAYQKAKAEGYDEALLLNRQGFLAEGSRSNLFLVKDGVILTPALRCGCLKGITRQEVYQLSKTMHLKFKETFIRPEDLFNAQEAFLTNSLIEIMPLTRAEDRRIGSGKMGAMTAQLLSGYRQRVQDTLRED